MLTRNVAATVHGRFLYEQRSSERLLVGFHGYAESAESSLAQLELIPGIAEWSLVAIQALHPFYAGGHEWTDAFRKAAGEFLRARIRGGRLHPQ